MKLSIKDFSSICDQILEKSLMESFIFCVVVKPKNSLKFRLYKCLDYRQMARGKCYFVIVNNFTKKTTSCWDKLSNVCSFSMSQTCLIWEPLTLKKYHLEYLAKLGSCLSYTLNAFLRSNVLLFSDGRMFLKTWILSFHLWLHKHFCWIHFWVKLVSRGWFFEQSYT